MKIVVKNGYNIVEPDCGTFEGLDELIALKDYALNPDNDCDGFYAENNGMVFDCEKGRPVPIVEKGRIAYILCNKKRNSSFNKKNHSTALPKNFSAVKTSDRISESDQVIESPESKGKEYLQEIMLLKSQLFDMQNEIKQLKNNR